MNYLAHALLSNNDKNLLVGNFIADHVRGNNFSAYPPEITEGIYLHRRIDAFTDAHLLFKQSKRLFYKGFEKHSGILVDIYFDHLLAVSFQNHHSAPLPDFSRQVYQVYVDHRHLLPLSSDRFLQYVIKNDIYTAYGTIEGIETVLSHLSQRIRHNVKLDESLVIFKQHEAELLRNFDDFFSEAIHEFRQ